MNNLRCLLGAFILAVSALSSHAAGVIPFALTQQIDVNGLPLANCKLYTYVVGTTATPQNMFSDFGLTTALPNPISCDQTGRLPAFYLADGQVHVRLTDSGGVTLVDIPVIQVIGPSIGGGGGGGAVDPNAIASTGDVKWRPTAEVLPGWVVLNATTIGNPISGANGRANADTQTLFVYLWNNCPDAHCPVSTGRGANGLADFNANKQLTLLDMRSRRPQGLDQMAAAAPAGRILASNITSGGGDGVNTPNATGGEANHTQLVAEMATHTHVNTLTDPQHNHTITEPNSGQGHAHSITDGPSNLGHAHSITDGPSNGGHSHGNTSGNFVNNSAGGLNIPGSGPYGVNASTAAALSGVVVNSALSNVAVNFGTTGIAINNHSTGVTITNVAQGSSTPANVMDPFMLGTWWMKL